MVEKIVAIYLVLAILLSGAMVVFAPKVLRRMKVWQVLLGFALSPLLALREVAILVQEARERRRR